MIRLDATNRKLQAVLAGAITTSQLPCTVSYSDKTSTDYVGATQLTNTNSTTAVDICAAPGASTIRDIDYLSIRNRDTVAATVTVMLDDNTTDYEIVKAALAVGDQLIYTHGDGWRVVDADGNLKTSATGGGGDVVGPASATANSLARFDGTTGKLLKDGAVIGTDVQAYSSILAGVSAGTTDLGGFRNRLINPRGAVYQRAVAATADDAYFADRWYALTQTGTITPSVLTDPEDGYPSGVRLTQSQASAQRFGFAQIIEGKNCKDMRGSSGVLVPRVRISNSQAIRYAILGWTGTEDTVTSDVVNDWTSGTYTAGNFFLAASVSVIAVGSQTPSANTWTSLTALTAALGSTFNNIVAMIWTEGTAAQNVTLDFDYVQFEKGAIALPFETRTYEHERSLCLPYTTELSSGSAFTLVSGYGYRVSTTIADTEIRLLPVMRSTPTLNTGGATFSSAGVTGNVWSVYNNVAAGWVTAVGAVTLTISNASKYGAQLRTTAGTSLSGSSGDGCTLYIGTTAKILLESEL